MPRARKRARSSDSVDLAAEPIGELDFDSGLPDRSSSKLTQSAERSRLNKRQGRPSYDHGSELGEGHKFGDAGDRYKNVGLDFEDGLRRPREIVVKRDEYGDIEDDEAINREPIDLEDESETIEKRKHGKKTPKSKAASHAHVLTVDGSKLMTTQVTVDEGVSHTHRVTIEGDTTETSSDPGGPGHEHTITVDGDKLKTGEPVAPTKKSEDDSQDEDESENEPSVSQVVDLVKQDKSEIQTLIFSKDRFKSTADAKQWAKENGFKSDKVDTTDESFRLRQKPPGDFQDGSFRTITLTDGVKAVIGRPKKKTAAAEKPEKKTTKKAVTNDEFPEVLTWQAVRKGLMPSEGSGIPASLEQDVPPAYRFWKCESDEDARRVRDALVESRIFTPQKVMKVDGHLRRAVVETIEKLYLAPEYDDAAPVEIPESRKPIEKVVSLLDGEGDRTTFPEHVTEVIGIETLLEKADALDGDWIIAAKDSPKVRKAIAGPCFKLWTNDDLVFVTNAKLKDPDSVEWVQRSRAEDLLKFAFSEGRQIRIVKTAKAEERIIFGIVLEPDGVDAQNDTISKDEIREAAHKFMEDFGNLGLQHTEIINGRLKLLESFIAPVEFKEGGQVVKAGSWLMKERVIDDELWSSIKAGKITGYSIGGSAIRRPA